MFDIYQLFESVGILIDSKLRELALDRTLECTIVSDTQKQNGFYTVSYDSTLFLANSSDLNLTEGDTVYVGVPQSDYSNAYIIAKKARGLKQETQVNPFKNFIKNIAIHGNASIDFLPDSETVETIALTSCTYTNPCGFTKMGIHGRAFTKYSDAFATNPKFGIYFYINQKVQYGDNEIIRVGKIIDFNISQLLGARVKHTGETGIIVEELFDISDIQNIVSITAQVYGQTVSNDPNFICELDNLTLFFGDMQDAYTQEGIYLYTDQEPTYTIDDDEDTLNRTVYARIVYQENEELKIVTHYTDTGLPDNIHIYWNQSTIENNELTYTVAKGAIKPFMANKTVTVKAIYNTLDQEADKEFTNSISFSNSTENKKRLLLNHSEANILTANLTNFKDLYSSDGTIIDYALTNNKQDYGLWFLYNPLVNSEASHNTLEYIKDNTLKLTIALSIPLSSNIVFRDYKKYGFVQDAEAKKQQRFIKTISDKNVTTDIKNVDSKFLFSALMPFGLAEYYVPNKNNNVITCDLILNMANTGEEIERISYNLSLDMSRSGICKSDYMLIAKMYNEKGEECRSIGGRQGAYIDIAFELYNAAGEQQEITRAIETTWLNRQIDDSSNILSIHLIDGIVNKVRLTYIPPSTINEDDIQYNYVLQGAYTITNSAGNYSLVRCYIPIAFNFSYNSTLEDYVYKSIRGPVSIVYNSAGGEPSFYQVPYGIYDTEGFLNITGTWEAKNYKIGNISDSFYPFLLDDNGEKRLHVPTMLISGTEASTVLKYSIPGPKGDIIQWIQPIVLWQTKSFSSFINDWNGKSIKQDDNKMMTPFLGAGKIETIEIPSSTGAPNKDSVFSGVLLGDVALGIEDTSATMTGVYGYHHNEQSYALKEDGSAFFGKAGAGRINFEGDLGLIYSGNFDGTFYQSTHEFYFKEYTEVGYPSNGETNEWPSNWVANDNDSIDQYITASYDSSNANYFQDNKMTVKFNLEASEIEGWEGLSQFNNLYPIFEPIWIKFEEQKLGGDKEIFTKGLIEWTIVINNISTAMCYLCLSKVLETMQLIHYSSNNSSAQMTINKIKVNHKVLNDDISIIPLYNNSKITITMEFTLSKNTSDTNGIYYCALTPLFCEKIKEDPTSTSSVELTISNVHVRNIGVNNNITINEFEQNQNIILYPDDYGTTGTFINLKDGQFITNNGVFRGNLEAQSLTLLNDLVLGDPANTEGKPWLRITPEGGFEASSVASRVKYIVGGSDAVTVGKTLQNGDIAIWRYGGLNNNSYTEPTSSSNTKLLIRHHGSSSTWFQDENEQKAIYNPCDGVYELYISNFLSFDNE